MDLLVQKPQFDAQSFRVGGAVHIKDVTHLLPHPHWQVELSRESCLKNIDTDAIVTHVAPLAISMTYFDLKKGGEKYIEIPVDLVADKKIAIKLMEVATND